MYFGYLLWNVPALALIIFGALAIFWLRSGRKVQDFRFWMRASLLLFVCTAVALVEGSLLSPYGFGWFVFTIVLTLIAVKKIAPKILNGAVKPD